MSEAQEEDSVAGAEEGRGAESEMKSEFVRPGHVGVGRPLYGPWL